MSKLNFPADGQKLAEIGRWTLFRMPPAGADDSFLWMRFKLMDLEAPKRWHAKRAFELRWNPLEQRLARHHDARTLEAQDALGHAAVVTWLDMLFDRAWLTAEDGGGYTEGEIEAELKRLAAVRAARRGRRRQGA